MNDTTTSNTEAMVGCDQCTGRLIYRVKLEGFRADADNFEQLVDHRPALFTHKDWLINVARERDGKVTVWRLADADQGGDFAEDVVIAYAGPHPSDEVPGRTYVLDLSGHGFYEELVDAACEGHESLAGSHMGETVYCDGSCQTKAI